MTSGGFVDFLRQLRELGPSLTENLVVLRSVPSTNQAARDVLAALPAEASPPVPLLIVAFEQTRGRGRLGRSWTSAPGEGLYCTLVRSLDERQAPSLLPLAVAVSLCGGLRELGIDCSLKWPNDLLVGGHKLGGILIEVVAPPSTSGATPGATAIIGFGVNLYGDRATLRALGATAISDLGAGDLSAAEVLAALAPSLRRLPRWLGSADELVASYRAMIHHRAGDRLRWRQGAEAVEGTYVDIDRDGHLLLDTPEGRRVLAVGDIIEP